MTSPSLLHIELFKSTKCSSHTKVDFSFYCFDCQMFLCTKCFKNHKLHNIEIKEDLEKHSSVFSEMPLRKNYNVLPHFEHLKDSLENLDTDIHRSISSLADMIEQLKKNGTIPFANQNCVSVFNLNHEEYKKLSLLVKFTDELKSYFDKIKKEFESCELKSYKNLKWINKEVSIIDSSAFHEGYEPEIVLGKLGVNAYYLGEGTKNHFISFDLNGYYFLKSVKMSVDNFECSVKNFEISVKDNYGDWRVICKYVRDRYNENNIFQEFPIHCEGRYFKFSFIDNWGAGGGPYILVKRISFYVGDMID